MANVTIRAAETSDAAAIFEIARCPKVRHGTLQMPFISLATVQERLASRPADLHQLVAEVDGRVVGESSLRVVTNPRRRHVGQLGMMVHDDFQRQGIGTALLRAILDLADNWLNLHRLELEVYVDNHPGIHLYESNGFVREGICRDYAFRDGEYADSCIMGRIREPRSRLSDADVDSQVV